MNNNFTNMSGFITNYYGRSETICPVCGNPFTPAPEHSYYLNDKRKLACSYTCVRKWEKNKMMKLFDSRTAPKVFGIRIVGTDTVFGNVKECAESLEISQAYVRKLLYEKRKYKGMYLEMIRDD